MFGTESMEQRFDDYQAKLMLRLFKTMNLQINASGLISRETLLMFFKFTEVIHVFLFLFFSFIFDFYQTLVI